MPTSIQQLNIYLSARRLEDSVVELAAELPKEQAYPLADDLRRAATAVAHYIYQAHHYYSYGMKIEALHQARSQAERTQRLLGTVKTSKSGQATKLSEDYTVVIKQSWGLIKYFKARQSERVTGDEAQAKGDLAAAKA